MKGETQGGGSEFIESSAGECSGAERGTSGTELSQKFTDYKCRLR